MTCNYQIDPKITYVGGRKTPKKAWAGAAPGGSVAWSGAHQRPLFMALTSLLRSIAVGAPWKPFPSRP